MHFLPWRVSAWLLFNGAAAWAATAWLWRDPASLARQWTALAAWLVLPLAGIALAVALHIRRRAS